MIETFQRKNINTAVQFNASSSGVIKEQANAAERLQARLQGDVNTLTQLAQPAITEETQKKAIEDVNNGKIDSDNVARFAQETYRRTAESSFMADVEVSAKDLGTSLVNEQTLNGKYNTASFTKSFSEYIKGATEGINDITVKTSIENRLNKMGSQFQGQVATLETSQQRNIQKANLTAKLEMDTEELKKATGVNPERTIELQTEITKTIWSMGSSNLITPLEAEQLHEGINKEAYIDHTQREFKVALSQGLESADKFIKKFDKSKQPLLDEKEKLSTTNSFYSQVSKLKRDIKNTQTSIVKTNTIDIDAGIRVLNSGKVPDDKLLLDEKVKTLPEKKQRDYQIATFVQSEMGKFSDLSLPEQEAFVNTKEAKEISDIYGVEVLDEAKKIIAQKKKLAKSDPLSLGIQDNLFEQPKEITVTDLTSLSERLPLSAVTSSQYGTSPKLLTSAEATNFTNYMADPTVTINQKQLLIAGINSEGSEIAESVYRQVGGKKAYNFAFSGELSSFGNSEGSKLALQGRNADITLDADLKIELQQKIKGVFNNFTAEYYNQNLQGLKDYTKGLILTGQDVDADDILENTLGLSVKYNTKQTILPYNTSQGDFESWLDNIEIPNRPDLTQALQDITDNTFSGNYQLHYYGPGKYLVWNPNDGSGYYAQDTEDSTKPFILDWDK